MSDRQFDLVLLDIELPDGNGVEFCAEVQAAQPNVSIFFLTSHTDLSEKVLSFSGSG